MRKLPLEILAAGETERVEVSELDDAGDIFTNYSVSA
jgi:hypothetical protein